MFRDSLFAGLAIWRRAALPLGAGLACGLFLAFCAWAAFVTFDPDRGTAIVGFGLLGSFVVAGWFRYCGRVASGGPARPADLLAGFALPLRAFAATMPLLAAVTVPALFAEIVLAPWVPPLARCAAAAAATLALAPFALAFSFPAMAPGGPFQPAYAAGWLGGVGAELAIIAVAAPGPAAWVLLEGYALDSIVAFLPISVASWGLGAVRLAGLACVLASVSAASCVWAAAHGWPRAAAPGR